MLKKLRQPGYDQQAQKMTQIYTRGVMPPLHDRPSLYDQSRPHYSPREIQRSETSASQYTTSQTEGNAWRPSQPRSPMSESSTKGVYEVPPAKQVDMYQSRPETAQKGPRESLPPLSSLFGSSTHQARPPPPPPSSYSNHSPTFPTASPLDPREPATPVHPDRPYENSYFQRPPVARQYSYNARPEPERLGIPQPAQSTTRPESPRYDSRIGLMDGPRAPAPASVNEWSPHSQPSRPELFARDTSSSFRTHQDPRQPSSAHRLDSEARPQYRDAPHSAPVTPTYPPTPSSTVAGDVPTTKDGLGPKIWTGTQFLPRFVRQADVPGEGMCYFYDDGTHCKTVIDGEIVNAHWGVTKAGKPRKRLAIACITCREKKIKCDPDYPRCVQCEKFGRICKFKNAPRGGHGSPDTPPADPEDSVSRPVSSRADLDSFKGEKRENSHSVSPRQVLRQATPDSETHHSKRQRNGYNDFTPVASEASPRPSVHETASPLTPWTEPTHSTILEHSALLRELHINPFLSQPVLATELLNVFFKHVPETAYCIFPEGPFRAWVLSSTHKSVDDLMLIYSILALGTAFSLKAEHKAYGAQYAAISRHACDNRHFRIQLVQSRLLLSLYYFATSASEESWDFCGGAFRAASGLKLNLEIEKTDDAYLSVFPYGLNRAGYAECRRRTFWSCYLIDRFNGFSSGHVSVLQSDDIFLRLPCDGSSFENQQDVQNPFFDVNGPPIQNSNWTIGSMSYLINIATIYGDVMANVYRTSQRPNSSASRNAFSVSYENATRRLRAWVESLPSCYTFSAENLARASNNGKLGIFMTMHTTYHTTAMKLNRYIQQYTLTKSQLSHHVSIAKQHAEDFLAIAEALSARNRSVPSSPNSPSSMHSKFCSPFVGYGIISAVDILTAKIAISSIPNRLASFSGAQSVLAELAAFWQSAKNQQGLVMQRIRDLAEIASSRDEQGGLGAIGFKFGNMGPISRDTGDGIFEMRDHIERTFSRDYDCVYA